MRYACAVCATILDADRVIIVIVKNTYYEKRRLTLCPEHAKDRFPEFDFSWAKD